MQTYTERWGELWEVFINKRYFANSTKARIMSKKKLLGLAKEFESFLVRMNETLRYAG